jgi:hypothetical protein
MTTRTFENDRLRLQHRHEREALALRHNIALTQLSRSAQPRTGGNTFRNIIRRVVEAIFGRSTHASNTGLTNAVDRSYGRSATRDYNIWGL